MSQIVDSASTEPELKFSSPRGSSESHEIVAGVVASKTVAGMNSQASDRPSAAKVPDMPIAARLSGEPLPGKPSDSATEDDSNVGTDANPVLQPDPVLYAEDLTVGEFWTSELREITAGDVQSFAELTGDHSPLHGDQSAESPYGKPIAHGLLGLSVLAGLGTRYPKASTLAFVSVEEWQFLAPVFFGDKVQSRNEILAIEQHGRRAVKVRWLRQLINEAGRVVQEGHFVTLVGSKNRSVQKAR